MIPGDLVVKGSSYPQWENHFFDPAHVLLHLNFGLLSNWLATQ